MSWCKTGCGRPSMGDHFLCPTCHGLWVTSPEAKRPSNPTSLTDFINRTRAERQNGRQT